MSYPSLILYVANFYPIRTAIQISLFLLTIGCIIAQAITGKLFAYLLLKLAPMEPVNLVSSLNLTPEAMVMQRLRYQARIKKPCVPTVDLFQEAVRSFYFFIQLYDMHVQENQTSAGLQLSEIIQITSTIDDVPARTLVARIFKKRGSLYAIKKLIEDYFSSLSTTSGN